MRKPSTCAPCPLYKKGDGFVLAKSLAQPTLLVQGEAPGSNEIEQGAAFVGKAGWWARKNILENACVDADNVVFDNTLRCMPPKNKKGEWYPVGKEREEAEACCRQYDVWDQYPKSIPLLCFGGKATKMYLDDERISEWHGHIEIRNGRVHGYTYHPSAVMRQPNLLPLVIREVRNVLDAGRHPERVGHPTVFKHPAPYIPTQLGTLVFDLEWNQKDEVTVFGMTFSPSAAYSTFNIFEQMRTMREYMMRGLPVAGHNVISADFERLPFKPESYGQKHILDTKILAHLAHAHFGGLGLLDLGSLVRFYFPTSDWKHDNSDALTYNGRDCAYTAKLLEALKNDITLTEQWHLVDKQQELAHLAVEMHKQQPIHIDTVALREMIRAQEASKQSVKDSLPINPNAPKQIIEWGNSLGLPIADAQYETLVKYYGRNKQFDTLIEYRQDVKSLKTWFPVDEDADVGLVRPEFNVTGTDVARFSCANPNYQNLPPHLRKLLIAPPGHMFVSFDASQIENRCVAWYAQDKQMLADFASGVDIHSTVAERMSEHVPSTRRDGKITGHATNYCETPHNLAKRLFGSWVAENVRKARLLQQAYFTTYPRIKWWQRGVSVWLENRGIMLRNVFGRVRYIYARNEHERQKRGCHFLGCSTGADIVNQRALDIWHELKLLPCLIVHDELVYTLPEDYGGLLLPRMHEILYSPVKEMGGMVFPWACKVGINYGELKLEEQ